MNRPLLFLSATVLLSATPTDSGQRLSGSGVPDHWYAYRTGKPLPKGALACANLGPFDWELERVPEKILLRQRTRGRGPGPPLPASLSPNSRLRSATSSMPLETAWLLGIDHGEFGGGLWFVSEKGEEGKLLDKNVVAMERFDDAVIVITGLAHMGANEGAVFRVKLANPRAAPEKLSDLESAPYAHFRESSSSMLVTTDQQVFRLQSKGRIETLKKFNAQFLYPNSVVKGNDGSVYVGMRFFVLRLIPGAPGYTEQWLLPTACRNFGQHWPTYGECGCARKKEILSQYQIE